MAKLKLFDNVMLQFFFWQETGNHMPSSSWGVGEPSEFRWEDRWNLIWTDLAKLISQMLHLWHIYLQNWLILGANVGSYSSNMVRIWINGPWEFGLQLLGLRIITCLWAFLRTFRCEMKIKCWIYSTINSINTNILWIFSKVDLPWNDNLFIELLNILSYSMKQ